MKRERWGRREREREIVPITTNLTTEFKSVTGNTGIYL